MFRPVLVLFLSVANDFKFLYLPWMCSWRCRQGHL